MEWVYKVEQTVVQGLRVFKPLNDANTAANIDFTNAFNSEDRYAIANEVADHFHMLKTWFSRWPGSDHFGILLACGGKEPRPVFRANMSLLKDKGCLAYIEDLASDMAHAVHAAHSQEERCARWDQFKEDVKEFLLHTGARKARELREKDAELLHQIRELEKGRGACPETRALWDEVGRKYQERLKEKLVIRKCRWERTMLEGGHDLFTLEAEEKSKGFALEGKTEDEMLAEAVPFYKDLFSKRVTTLSALSRIGSFIKHDEDHLAHSRNRLTRRSAWKTPRQCMLGSRQVLMASQSSSGTRSGRDWRVHSC